MLGKRFGLIIRWIARICSIGVVLLFGIFFIGEGIPDLISGDFSSLNIQDILLLIFIPGFLFIAIFQAWKNEFKGGIAILGSVFVFNIISYIFSKDIGFEIDFWYIFGLGILFLFSYLVNRH